jgi:hypothetical protein
MPSPAAFGNVQRDRESGSSQLLDKRIIAFSNSFTERLNLLRPFHPPLIHLQLFKKEPHAQGMSNPCA